MDKTDLIFLKDSLLASVAWSLTQEDHLKPFHVVLCKDEAEAARGYEVLAGLVNKDLKSSIAHFPGFVQSGLFRFENAQRMIAARLRALLKLNQNALHAVVTTPNGLLRLAPSSEWIKNTQFIIKKQDEVDQEILLNTLNQYGFRQVARVEEPGHFAVRGQLVDIFSPAQKHPVRVEFFGDTIESLRLFRTKDQRSYENREQVVVLPTREFLWPQGEALKGAGERWNQALLSQGLTGQSRADLYENLEHATPFPGVDDVYPLFSTSPAQGFASWLNQWSQNQSPKRPVKITLWGTGHAQTAQHVIKTYEDASGNARFRGHVTIRHEQLYPGLRRFSEHFEEFLEDFKFEKNPINPNLVLENEWISELKNASSQKMAQRSEVLAQLLRKKKIASLTIATNSLESWNETCGVLGAHSDMWHYAQPTTDQVCSLFDSPQKRRSYLSDRKHPIAVSCGDIETGFVLDLESKKHLIVSETWLRGVSKLHAFDAGETRSPEEQSSPNQNSQDNAQRLLALQSSDFAVGDRVIHIHYGRARYLGLSTQTIAQTTGDYLVLQFAGNDKIYVPVHRMGLVQRYMGAPEGEGHPDAGLDSLGSVKEWERRKSKAKEEAQRIAKELMEHQARRESTPGHAFSRIDEDYVAFESQFPYDETPCQLRAMREIHADMERPKAMDRLLCGDVGFGKTELAMRAAYRAVLDKKQVAVLVPTTILAHQHGRSFKERFADFAANIRVLDRSVSAQNSNKIKKEIENGNCDIIIGTHKILTGDLRFKDLGLVIVDEEQRFGVQQKEKLKTLSYGVDVLTMSATPIPRTLQLAMLGLRDLSLLSTPPKARLAVQTCVVTFEELTIKEAIEAELSRGGQIFYVHNRVEELEATQAFLQKLCPQLRIVVGHGKMSQKSLDDTIIRFTDSREADLLLCTTIIESGIDMPGVNTIIIQNADHFGLAQLYQLRGRVGRRSTKGYAYFLLSPGAHKDSEGHKRLELLAQHQDLGSGFIIASHDLELRGAGNILGEEQNGTIADVGLETYSQMLMEAVHQLGGVRVRAETDVEIQIPIAAQVPESYIEDPRERLRVYRRFYGTRSEAVLTDLIKELEDMYGPCPEPVLGLVELARLRRWLWALGATSLLVKEDNTELKISTEILQSQDEDAQRIVSRILDAVNRQQRGARITPDGRVILPVRKGMFPNQQSASDALGLLKSFLGRVAGELKG